MMTPMLMTRYTSTAVLLLGLWTLPSSGEVTQNSSHGTCSAPMSQNGALALVPTVEYDTLYLTVNAMLKELKALGLAVNDLKDLSQAMLKELKDVGLAVIELKDRRLAVIELKDQIAAANNSIDKCHEVIDRMFWMMVIFLSVIGLGLLGLYLYKTFSVLNIGGIQNIFNGPGTAHVVVHLSVAAEINSNASDQSMPGTAEVPTNRSESADPAGLTNAAPDGVPVGAPDAVPVEVPVEVPVTVQVDEPVPASTTDNTASLVTMKTNSQKSDDREDDETLVPLSLETPH
ncbi:uncharacterized protein LOC131940456 isoform X2 [Physella acuta]|uniref:uncharacterized protein LOC131940456 isoform X2 n=1 Tax=Physella acuta TaxID=109671 RepID=UPI0027DDF7F4|nr:uncharacterized protein LOC131940456 isoform X2 [Physella acuta]